MAWSTTEHKILELLIDGFMKDNKDIVWSNVAESLNTIAKSNKSTNTIYAMGIKYVNQVDMINNPVHRKETEVKEKVVKKSKPTEEVIELKKLVDDLKSELNKKQIENIVLKAKLKKADEELQIFIQAMSIARREMVAKESVIESRESFRYAISDGVVMPDRGVAYRSRLLVD